MGVTKLSCSCLSESGFNIPLNRGYSEMGLTFGLVTSGLAPALSSSCATALAVVSSERVLKYRGLSEECSDNDFETCAGGNRLMRLVLFLLTASNSIASFLLCAAKASRGEREGGMSPS